MPFGDRNSVNCVWKEKILVRSACLFLFVVCNYPVVLSHGLHWAQLAPEREFYGESCYVCKG